MGVKVAFATRDGRFVNEHFARARRFLVYELKEGRWSYLEERNNPESVAGNGHCDDLLGKTADLIADCGGVVVEHIGPGAIDLLINRRIMPLMLPGTIEAALQTLLESNSIRFFR